MKTPGNCPVTPPLTLDSSDWQPQFAQTKDQKVISNDKDGME